MKVSSSLVNVLVISKSDASTFFRLEDTFTYIIDLKLGIFLKWYDLKD